MKKTFFLIARKKFFFNQIDDRTYKINRIFIIVIYHYKIYINNNKYIKFRGKQFSYIVSKII